MSQPQFPNAQREHRDDRADTAPLARVPASGNAPRGQVWQVFGLWQVLGLVAVAVVSGVLWYALHAGSTGQPRAANGSGEFSFTAVRGPVQDRDCAAAAYGDVADYLAEHPCRQLSRTLYTSTPDAGREVLTSVSAVRMPNQTQARELRRLTDTDETGNVADLVRAGYQVPGSPRTLAGGGYASSRRGAVVVIVESDYLGAAPRSAGRLLDRVSEDALRLGTGSLDG